jgi:RNA polymerase sigma-B factor
MLGEARHAPPAERRRLLDEVTVRNMEVARSIAAKYRSRGIPSEDLEQVAYVALVRAADRFDPEKADDFLTYAVPTIRGEIKRHFRDHGWTVRPPRRIQEVRALINHDRGEPIGATNAPADIAGRIGVKVAEVEDALNAQGCFHPVSLETPLWDGAADTIGGSLVNDDFDEHAAVEARVILRTLTKQLQPRERLILYLRFVENRNQAEIGEEIGVTQMQVSRLLSRILEKMRAQVASGEHQVAS